MKRAKDVVARTLRNQVLNDADPMCFFECRENGREEHLGFVMTDAGQFIEHCYDMDYNPLPHLRSYFPGFEWAYHIPSNTAELGKIVVAIDYVWSVSPVEWSFGIVTALRKRMDGPPRMICFIPASPEGGDEEAWIDVESLLKNMGVRFLVTTTSEGRSFR
jgi:hypothetical protein